MIIFASRNQAGTVKKRKMSVPLLSDEFTPLSDNMKYGFDNEKYVRIQSEHIKERIRQFGDKLYLELGGKLFDDNHASRVLPGFEPDS